MNIIQENADYEKVIAEIILDEASKLIPESLKRKLSRKSFRKSLLEKHGSRAFLMPDKLKFPVMDESGSIHPGLVKAAYMRARQHGYGDVASKAKDMMSEYQDIPVMVAVEGHEEPYEIGFLLDTLELDFTKINEMENAKTMFHDEEGNLIVKVGDCIEFRDEDTGEPLRGRIKVINGDIAIVDVDGEEKSANLNREEENV